ncbi:unnamed protein product [Durusdinium trenchii]|uniref:Uncharacterized protein n=2 Tax=Durusdinium trenchii TaxID=1381693 RepID=A0ABP0JSD5_9DINO
MCCKKEAGLRQPCISAQPSAQSRHGPCLQRRILMMGLEGAGKTSLLYQLKLDENVRAIPVLGFNVEAVEYKNLSLSVIDLEHHQFKDEMQDVPLLVYDLPGAMRAPEVTDKLGLLSLRRRQWFITATATNTEGGLYEGLD